MTERNIIFHGNFFLAYNSPYQAKVHIFQPIFEKDIKKKNISAYDTSNRINLAIFFFLICGNVNNLIISVTIHVFTKLWNCQWQSSSEWTLVNPVNHLAWMEISRCFLKGEAVFGQQPSPCCAKKTPSSICTILRDHKWQYPLEFPFMLM